MKHLFSGVRSRTSPMRQLYDWKTTGGDLQEPLAHAVLTPKYTMIAALSTGVACPIVNQGASANGSWKSGTSSSCSTIRTSMANVHPSLVKTLIRVWDLSVSQWLFRAKSRSLIQICFVPSSTISRTLPTPHMVTILEQTPRSALSPTMRAHWFSLPLTVYCRATRDAATSSVVFCAVLYVMANY